MTDYAALLAAACSHPREDTPRLILADWLEDQGDPGLAAFIRVQVALANDPPHKQTSYPNEPSCLTPHGDRHYSFTGYLDEGFQVGDRVDFLAHRPLQKPKMVYGLRVYKITPASIPTSRDELDVYVRRDKFSKPWGGQDLLRRELELWNTTILGRTWFFLPGDGLHLLPAGVGQFSILVDGRSVATGEFARGFPDTLTCTAEAWLGGVCRTCGISHEFQQGGPCSGIGRTPGLWESLYWSSTDGRTVKCPECREGYVYSPGREHRHGGSVNRCKAGCDEKGTVPRPMPATAVPLTRLVLTTWPNHREVAYDNLDTLVRVFSARFPGLSVTVEVPPETHPAVSENARRRIREMGA